MEAGARDAFKTLLFKHAAGASSKESIFDSNEDLMQKVIHLCVSQPLETIRRVVENYEGVETDASFTEVYLARQFGDVSVFEKMLSEHIKK